MLSTHRPAKSSKSRCRDQLTSKPEIFLFVYVICIEIGSGSISEECNVPNTLWVGRTVLFYPTLYQGALVFHLRNLPYSVDTLVCPLTNFSSIFLINFWFWFSFIDSGSDKQVVNKFVFGSMLHLKQQSSHSFTGDPGIVFVWSRNSANKTKAFIKGLLAREMKIVGGATY